MPISQQGLQKKKDSEGNFKREPEKNEFIPEVGQTYVLRVLPRDMDEYEQGAEDFTHVYKFHFSYPKPNGTKVYNVPCPKTYGSGQNCPICAEGWELYNSNNEQDKAVGSSLYRKERALLNIVNLTDEKGVACGVQWFRAPKQKIYEEIRNKYLLNQQWWKEGKDILDLTVGRNFTLEVVPADRSGTGFVDYRLTPSPDSFDITPYLQGDWRERINSLKTHMPEATEEIVKEMITSTAPSASSHGTGGEQEKEPPAPKSEVPPPPPPAGSQGQASTPPEPEKKEEPKVEPEKKATTTTTLAPEKSDVPPPPPPPVPAAETAKKEEPKAEVKDAPAQTDKGAGDKPECFGKDYDPRSDKCTKCKADTPDICKACVNKYLDLG